MTVATPLRDTPADPFWEHAARGKLAIPHCQGCDRWLWPPTAGCPYCDNTPVWRPVAGTGVVHSSSAVHRSPAPAISGDTPYVVAFVDLSEGPRIMTRIVTDTPGAVAIGDRVRVIFRATEHDDLAVPAFVLDRPDQEGSS